MRGSRIAGALLWLVLAAVPARAAEIPYRLADINQTPVGSSSDRISEEPSDFFELGGRLLFSTADFENVDGGILWSTDGTAQGTVQISSSICPVPCYNIVPLKIWNGIALLRIGVGYASSSSSFRLARTDGTAAGTYLLADSLDADPVFGPPGFFYFEKCKNFESCEIWRSDGTRAGTRTVPAANHLPFFDIHSLASWRDKLCFIAIQPADSEYGLWCSDGSTDGTVLLARIQETPDSRSLIVATPSHLFYTSGETGEDLWVTDGTPGGSRRLADFEPVACFSHPFECAIPDVNSLVADGDAVYFVTYRQGHGAEIWRSDGTEGGTRPLIELPGSVVVGSPRRLGGRWVFPAAVSGQPVALWTADEGFSAAAPLTVCDGGECPVFESFFSESSTVPQLFLGEDAAHGLELWVTDGTGPGTRRLSDACPGSCPGFRPTNGLPSRLGVSAGRTWFRAYPSPEAPDQTGNDLWVTDGTPGGTHRAAGNVAGTNVGFLGGLTYFGSGQLARPASELWVTGGATGAVRRVTVLRRFASGSSPLFQPLRDGVLLHPVEADQLRLWKSDGTPEGTMPLAGFPPDSSRIFARFLSPAGSLQFFEVYHQSGRPETPLSSEIWRSDGSSPGTRRVAALDRDESVGPFTSWAGKLLFVVGNLEGCSLWSSDGTAPGTRRLLRPLPGVRCPTALVDLGSRFLFIARVKAGRKFVPQVFVSDGTPAGTRQISALQEAREPFYNDQPIEVGGTVYFRISGPSDIEPEIWQTDGASRTRRVSLLNAAADLYAFGDSLYFTALLSENNGRGLFRVSPGGGPPVLLARITPSPDSALSAWPAQFSIVGDRLLFVGTDLERGTELWITDGTPTGTRRLRDIQPGHGSSAPQGLVSTGDSVFFSADDGTHGRELWESDGTAEGTRLVADLAPGGFSGVSLYSSLAIANGFLFFGADDGRTGLEPWALRLEP